MGRIKLRSGYAWAQNPLAANPTANIGGIVPPGGLPAYDYSQALLADAKAEVHISGVMNNMSN